MRLKGDLHFACSLALAATLLVTSASWAQDLGSLKRVRVPEPTDIGKYVRDPQVLVALGKALFWDMQVASDGRTACATCHFHAGADHRAQNQLVSTTGSFPVNHTLVLDNFPFHVVANVNDNRSAVLRDNGAVVGSAGLFRRLFVDVVSGDPADSGFDVSDVPAFSINGINARRVTTRNTPTVINAVFTARNFWDGRASNVFTGFTPFGDSDQRLNVLAVRNGRLAAERVRVENASLASQAVGPPLNEVEMSYEGRSWPKLGKKMLALRPLALQSVAPDDSVLGEFVNPDGVGLHPQLTYLAMVQLAFHPEYWSSQILVDRQGGALGRIGQPETTAEFTQTEFNFALVWGLAIQAYESTLVSDDSRFDRFFDGTSGALTAQEQEGMRLFRGTADCTDCHVGPELSMASFTALAQRGPTQRRNGTNRDTGFFRVGVRPISDDIGLAANDDFGRPLSVVAARGESPAGVAGIFKTPVLRNVEFTGPYFHNGGQATLAQVVDFYLRGSDFPDGGLGPGIQRRNLSVANRQALVAFLKSLSDDRVRFERAPFDHPELCVPVGHIEVAPRIMQTDSDGRFPLSAAERWVGIPAVGKNGNTVPLQTFDELLSGVGADGSRAHALTDSCTIRNRN